MRVIVHGGMQKTGSSAIQDYLANSRAALAEIGVLYPDFGHREHWHVTAAFVGKAEMELADAPPVRARRDCQLGRAR